MQERAPELRATVFFFTGLWHWQGGVDEDGGRGVGLCALWSAPTKAALPLPSKNLRVQMILDPRGGAAIRRFIRGHLAPGISDTSLEF